LTWSKRIRPVEDNTSLNIVPKGTSIVPTSRQLRREFDALADGGSSAATPQEDAAAISQQMSPRVADAVDRLIDAHDRDSLDSIMAASRLVNPDQAARAIELGVKYNTDPAFVRKNMESFERREAQQRLIDFRHRVQSSPALREWITKPENAAIAGIDFDPLDRLGRAVQDYRDSRGEDTSAWRLFTELPEAFGSGALQVRQSYYGLQAAFGGADPDIAAQEFVDAFLDMQEYRKRFPSYRRVWDNVVGQRSEDVSGRFQQFISGFEGLLEGRIVEGSQAFFEGGIYTVGNVLAMIYEATVAHPRGFLSFSAEQLANSMPMLVTGGYGGAVGSLSGNPAGAFYGFMSGTFAGASVMGAGEWIMEALERRGINPSSIDEVRSAFRDPEVMGEIRNEAIRNGIAYAAVETLGTLFAGKAISRARAASVAEGLDKMPRGRFLRAASGEALREATFEAGGVLSGQLAATGSFKELDFGDAVLEAIGSLGHSSVQIAMGTSFREKLPDNPVKAAQKLATMGQEGMETLTQAQYLQDIGEILANSQHLKDVPGEIEAYIRVVEQIQDRTRQQIVNQYDLQVEAGEHEGKTEEQIQAEIDSAVREASNLYFNVDEWDITWSQLGRSGRDEAQRVLDGVPGVDVSRYDSAKQGGSPMEIPLSAFIAKNFNEEFYPQLIEIARSRPGGMSVTEARDYFANLDKTFEEVMIEMPRRGMGKQITGADAEVAMSLVGDDVFKESVRETALERGVTEAEATNIVANEILTQFSPEEFAQAPLTSDEAEQLRVMRTEDPEAFQAAISEMAAGLAQEVPTEIPSVEEADAQISRDPFADFDLGVNTSPLKAGQIYVWVRPEDIRKIEGRSFTKFQPTKIHFGPFASLEEAKAFKKSVPSGMEATVVEAEKRDVERFPRDLVSPDDSAQVLADMSALMDERLKSIEEFKQSVAASSPKVSDIDTSGVEVNRLEEGDVYLRLTSKSDESDFINVGPFTLIDAHRQGGVVDHDAMFSLPESARPMQAAVEWSQNVFKPLGFNVMVSTRKKGDSGPDTAFDHADISMIAEGLGKDPGDRPISYHTIEEGDINPFDRMKTLGEPVVIRKNKHVIRAASRFKDPATGQRGGYVILGPFKSAKAAQKFRSEIPGIEVDESPGGLYQTEDFVFLVEKTKEVVEAGGFTPESFIDAIGDMKTEAEAFAEKRAALGKPPIEEIDIGRFMAMIPEGEMGTVSQGDYRLLVRQFPGYIGEEFSIGPFESKEQAKEFARTVPGIVPHTPQGTTMDFAFELGNFVLYASRVEFVQRRKTVPAVSTDTFLETLERFQAEEKEGLPTAQAGLSEEAIQAIEAEIIAQIDALQQQVEDREALAQATVQRPDIDEDIKLRAEVRDFRTITRSIVEAMKGRLRRTGRLREDQINALAQISRGIGVLAKRSGLALEDFLQRFPLPQILRERLAGATQELTQRPTGVNTPLQGKVFFHRTSLDTTTIQNYDQFDRQPGAIFGPGLHLTTDQSVATARSLTPESMEGSVIAVGFTERDPKLLNMEEPLPRKAEVGFEKFVKRLSGTDELSIFKDGASLEKGLTGKDLYASMLSQVREGVSANDVTVALLDLQEDLVKRGFHGFRYLGKNRSDSVTLFAAADDKGPPPKTTFRREAGMDIEVERPTGHSRFIDDLGSVGEGEAFTQDDIAEMQLDSHDLFQDIRGLIQFFESPDAIVSAIVLHENADITTYIHEMGHFYLRVMEDLVESGRAPQQIIDDYNTALKWLGAKPGTKWADLTTDQQEKWAQGFEAYIMDGKFPTEELRGAFERLKEWMLQIYKTFKRIGGKVNAEVRGVMDRILAVDEEIELATSEPGVYGMYEKVKGIGLTDKRSASYAKQIMKAKSFAKDKIRSMAMAAVMGERKKNIDAQKKKYLKKAEEAWKEDPRYQARERISKEGVRRDNIVQEGIDSGMTWLVRASAEWGTPRWDTVASLDQIAEDLGFRTSPLLLEALKDTVTKGEFIKNYVEEAVTDYIESTREKTQRAQEEKIAEAVNNADYMKLLRFEREHMLTEGFRDAKNLGKKLVRDPLPPDEEIRRVAKRSVRAMKVREIRPHLVQGQIKRLGVKAMDAFFDGDFTGAIEFKTMQIEALARYDAMIEAKAVIDDAKKRARKILKESFQKILGFAGVEGIEDSIFYDAFLGIVSAFRLLGRDAKDKDKTLFLRVAELSRFLHDEETQAHGVPEDLGVDEFGQSIVGDFRDINVGQMSRVRNALAAIEFSARNRTKILLGGRRRDKAAMVGAMEKEVRSEKAKKSGLLGKLRAKVEGAASPILTTAAHVQGLAGEDTRTALYSYLVRPILDAFHRKTNPRLDKMQDELEEMIRARYSQEEINEMGSENIVIRELGMTMSRLELLSLAQLRGTETGTQALLDASNQFSERLAGKLGVNQIDIMLSYLDERDWKFVHDRWAYFETFVSEGKAAYLRQTGVKMELVAPKPFTITMKSGERITAEGGYWPLKYDNGGSVDAQAGGDRDIDSKQMILDFKRGKLGVISQVSHNFTKTRRGSGGKPVRLDNGVFRQALRERIIYITLGDEVLGTSRLLNDKDLAAAFNETGNNHVRTALSLWVDDVAFGQLAPSNFVDKAFRYLRASGTVAKVGGSFTTMAVQVTGIIPAVARIGAGNVLAGLTEYAMNFRAVTKMVHEMSPLMERRSRAVDADIDETNRAIEKIKWIPRLFDKMGIPRKYQRNAKMALFWGTIKLQHAVDIPVFLGAYRGYIAQGMSESDAIFRAERDVVDLFASGEWPDRVALARGTLSNRTRQQEWARMFSFLSSYAINKVSLSYLATLRASDKIKSEPGLMPSLAAVMGWATDMSLIFMLEGLFAALILGHFPDEEEDETTVPQFAWRVMRREMTNSVPFVSDIASHLLEPAFLARGSGSYGSFLKALMSISEERGGIVPREDETAAEFLKRINRPLQWTGYPGVQIGRFLDAYIRNENGEDVPLRDIFFGRPFKR
jgi:hypothetical protein